MYVQGVAAGYDHARRQFLDDLRVLLNDPPETPENVLQRHRWGWINEWARGQDRPPTPDQPFQD